MILIDSILDKKDDAQTKIKLKYINCFMNRMDFCIVCYSKISLLYHFM